MLAASNLSQMVGQFQPSLEAIAAALRARSLDLRGALAARVLICFSILLSRLSLRFPIKISFQHFFSLPITHILGL